MIQANALLTPHTNKFYGAPVRTDSNIEKQTD